MRKFINNIVLLLVIFNLFSFITFAELETGSSFELGNSTGVIVPLPSDEKEDEQQPHSTGNNGGGGYHRPTVKPDNQTELEQNINIFDDVNKNDWFYTDVIFVFNNKIMTGTSESKFSPDTTLNRAMMITILHRIDGNNSIYEKDIFNDVEKNSWYENAVNWGYENKIVAGTSENTFAPMDNLTREQLCVMLYNYTKHIGIKTEFADISHYSDEKTVSDWAKDAVSWAVQTKIVTGKGNNLLAPEDSASRAEAAAVIRRYTEKFAEIKEK